MKQLFTTVTIMMLVCAAAWAADITWDYTQPYTPDAYTMLLLHFDESAGSTYAADSSGGGYNAVLATGNTNGWYPANQSFNDFNLDPFTTWVTGQAGFGNCAYAYYTDDTNNNVGSMVITDNGDLSTGTDKDYTFEWWMNPADAGGGWGSRILKAQTGSTYNIGYQNGNISLGWYKGGWVSVIDSTTIAIDTWTHVAIVVDSTSLVSGASIINFYVNGNLSSSHTTADTEAFGNYNTGPVQLFNDATGGLYTPRQFMGKLDEMRISNVNRFNVGPLPVGNDLPYDWQNPFTSDTATMLLLHMDETSGSTVAVDSSDTPYNFALTTGNTNAWYPNVQSFQNFDLDPNATWVTSQPGFGNCAYSWYEDDTNNNVGPMVFVDSGGDLAVRSDQDYTIEFWMNPDGDGSSWGERILKKYTGGSYSVTYSLGNITLGWYSGGWLSVTDTNTTIPVGEWTHVAIVIESDSFYAAQSEVKFFFNGTLSSTHLTGALGNWDTGNVGIFNDGYVSNLYTARQFMGKLDEIRMSNINRYQAANDTPAPPPEPAMTSEWWKPFEYDTGTIVLMHLDETTGSIAHDTAPNPIYNDGTLGIGGVTFFDDRSSDTNIPHAVFNRSLGHFDANNGMQIVIPNTADLNCTRSVTLEAWVYPTAWGGANRTIIEKISYPTDAHPLNSAYSLGFWFTELQGSVTTNNGHGVYTRLQDYMVPENKWTHIAMSYDMDLWPMVRLYINGQEATGDDIIAQTATNGLTIYQNNGPLLIGAWKSSGGPWYSGYIDEVRVSNVGRQFIAPDPTPALTIEQVTGDVDLSFTSAQGSIYLVQTTTDLTQPWELLLGQEGSFNLSYYTHLGAGVDQQRFYRVNLFEPVSMGYAAIAEKTVAINGLINEWTASEKIATRNNFFDLSSDARGMGWYQMDVYAAVDTTGGTDALIVAWETDYLGATDVIEIMIFDESSDSNTQYQIAFDSFGQMTSYVGNAGGIAQRPGGTGAGGDFVLADFQAAGGVFQDAKFSGKWSGEIKIPYDFIGGSYTFDPGDQRLLYVNRAAQGNLDLGTTNPYGVFWSWSGGVFTNPDVGVTR